MSNYNLKAKNRESGIIEDATAIDYGDSYEYIVDDMQYASKVFNELYEIVEDPNHPYGGIEEYDKKIEYVMKKDEQVHGCQYNDKNEIDIYFDGFKDGRAMMRIDLLNIIKPK